jgi:membrane associated rhomboid family serine protease
MLLPNQTRFSPRALPWLTLALAVANLVVYLLFQGGDRAAAERAWEYYASSRLPTVELTRYAAHLERRNDARSTHLLRLLRSAPSEAESRAAVIAMQRDAEFMRDLNNGLVVRKDEPGYAAWREQRDRFQALLSQVFSERYALMPDYPNALSLVSYAFLHPNAVALLVTLVILLAAGPFAEAALGRWRFLLVYLGSTVVSGAAYLPLGTQPLMGAGGALAGMLAAVAVLYGSHQVPALLWAFRYDRQLRVTPLWLLPLAALLEAVRWYVTPANDAALIVPLVGFATGAILAWLLQPAAALPVERPAPATRAVAPGTQRHSTLLTEARQAAARLDTKRAAQAYSELLQEDPTNTEYAAAYFNMALQGRDKDVLADAAVRVLWIRARNARSELRPVYTQMSLPHVLAALPIDEQLRLARRLVATREDAAALRVLDTLLGEATTRNLYGRQLADCLLGLFTTYSRHGLKAQADQVRARLARHFPSPATLGGAAPSREPPLTIRGATTRGTGRGNPATVPASDLELDLDTRMHTRWD